MTEISKFDDLCDKEQNARKYHVMRGVSEKDIRESCIYLVMHKRNELLKNNENATNEDALDVLIG